MCKPTPFSLFLNMDCETYSRTILCFSQKHTFLNYLMGNFQITTTIYLYLKQMESFSEVHFKPKRPTVHPCLIPKNNNHFRCFPRNCLVRKGFKNPSWFSFWKHVVSTFFFSIFILFLRNILFIGITFLKSNMC